MRIISGKYKSRKITPPKNLPVRPTTDLSKEGLFNVLNNRFHFDEIKVLDLFSGTGNISFEFGSRGCNDITAVDTEYQCIKFIKQTSKAFNFDITAIKSDVFKFLQSNKCTYTIIFADPPYQMPQNDFEKIISLVFENHLIEEQGLLIIEHATYTKMDHLNYLSFQKKYGGSIFSFFEITITP